jgi:ABC-2 type transport system ATP-binding protein
LIAENNPNLLNLYEKIKNKMLKVENLVKKYKDVTAVDNISFLINKGEIFGLLGPNGAGKTTTIRTILDVLKPTSGKITYNYKKIDKNKIGYLPEDRGLYRKSKIIDVIVYLCRMKAVTEKDALIKAEDWLKRLGLINQKNKKVEELSRGNQQKIQFIIAVIHEPELLVLDEPFSGFDPINRELITEEILKLKREGKIIIISTHQMETAELLCQDLLLINKGKEVYYGNLRELKNNHKKNIIRIGFREDAADVINKINIPYNVELNENIAEIELTGDITPSEFLRSIAASADITDFNIVEPSLHSIFIELIRSEHSG